MAQHYASLRALPRRFRRDERKRDGKDADTWSNAGFDQRYGIRTSGFVDFLELRSGRSSDAYATAYAPSGASLVRRTLQMLPVTADYTFLDLGCGEGRALVIASEFPLRAIIGVELSPALCERAAANASIIADRFPERTPIQIVEADAGEFVLPRGPLIVYMYHPFYRPVMRRVVANLERASAASEEVFIVYVNPVLGHLWDSSSCFTRFFAGMLRREEADDAGGAAADEAVVIWGSRVENAWANADRPIRVTAAGWRADTGP